MPLIPDPETPVGPFRAGDWPGTVPVSYLDTDTDTRVDWDGFAQVVADLIDPAGLATAIPVQVDVDEPTILLVDFPAPLAGNGIHQLVIRATTAATTTATEPLPVIVESPAGWLSIEMARILWPDARSIPDLPLWIILDAARAACVAYAPALPVVVPPAVPVVPANYIQAQLSQARAVWNLMQTQPQSDLIGYDQTAVRVYPLDYNVRQLLRPKSGRPVMW